MGVVAETRSGTVEGLERDDVCVFRGIPFAAPPVGPLRFRPPAREAPWEGVRDATRFSPESAQGPFPMATLLGGREPVRSEDSLYLNVWTPAPDDAQRPVLVWIHGGAFLNGSGATPWYDGTGFASQGDVVVVTINYRLAAFGFLHLAERFGDAFEGSGNLGLLDQVAALEWVHESIEAFGGDPDDVTVFGESAGGASVATLLAMPAARGLFRGAIAQSGAASFGITREHADQVTGEVLDALAIGPGNLDALLRVPTDDLIAVSAGFRALVGKRPRLRFAPVLDGAVVPEEPLDAIRGGSAAGVRLLTGTNRDEMTLFALMDDELATIDHAQLVARLNGWIPELDAEALVARYAQDRPGATPRDLWLAITTDAVFRIPAIRLAEAQVAHGPVWMYRFTWATPVFSGMLQSTHALEIPFVWDNLDRPGSAVFTGDGPERQELATRMHRAWTEFARTGAPGHDGLPDWPRYDLERRATMQFDVHCETVDDPDGGARRSWDGV
jgi:para-nitrobenzyl esterase